MDSTIQLRLTNNNCQLCYTRGTVIPCVMIIETSDQQALDLLSSPRAVVVRLQRRIIYSTELASHHTNKDPVLQTTDDYPASAVWWPSFDGGGYRRLDGEIQLSRYLKPSFAVSHFSLSVRPNSLLTYHCLICNFMTLIVQCGNPSLQSNCI